MKNKIYIAGSGGMLGDAFYKIFNKNYKLRCTDKDPNDNWIDYLDFRDFEKYKKDVFKFNPNYLFHLGAHTDLEYCEKNQDDAFITNTISVDYAINISNSLEIPLIYISTAGIFDGQKKVYNDWDIPNPLCCYAKSKYFAERSVIFNSKKYLILRPGWMMGGGIKKDKKFVFKIISQILEGKKILYIVNDRMGTPTYTFDFALNTKLIIENDKWGLFNLVCHGETSRLEVAREILKILNLEKKIIIKTVRSSFFHKTYFSKRPKSEMLLNYKLKLMSLDYMRDWKVCLKEYLNKNFKKMF
jgi:dTDP-4-dehydrorhamnose reductase|tara:strand:+ start:875 stop:1774 length:900 start_codon:yes stop_codon:yes gene_type:complete